MSTNEVMDPALMEALRGYRSSMERHEETQSQFSKAIILAASVCAILFALSFVCSALEGPVNRSAWYGFFTLVTFIGGCVAFVFLMAMSATKIFNNKPQKPDSIRTVEEEDHYE